MKGTKNNAAWWFDRGGQEADYPAWRRRRIGSGRCRFEKQAAYLARTQDTMMPHSSNHLAQSIIWTENKGQLSERSVAVTLDAEHAAALSRSPDRCFWADPGSGESGFSAPRDCSVSGWGNVARRW
jgi:hypothetical protein